MRPGAYHMIFFLLSDYSVLLRLLPLSLLSVGMDTHVSGRNLNCLPCSAKRGGKKKKIGIAPYFSFGQPRE